MDTFDAALYAKMFDKGIAPFISNVRTRIELWTAGSHTFPVSINETEWEACYVCSPYNHYVTYAAEECDKLDNAALRGCLRLFLRGFGLWVKRAELNRCVHINNFLLSTNLYPDWDGTGIGELHRRSLNENPTHAIVFRSLTRALNGPIINQLLNLGYRLIPTRRVWLFDSANKEAIIRRRDFASDARLAFESDFRYVSHEEFQETDFAWAEALYRMLYLEKYSRHNPQFTSDFLRYCHHHNLFHFHGLRDANGNLAGVAGGFRRGRVITNPIFGYDTSLPRERGLYRLLTHIVMRETLDHGWLMNLSAGVGRFKQTRGGTPEIEYSAVFYKHLPPARQHPWSVLRWLTSHVGMPLVQKFDL